VSARVGVVLFPGSNCEQDAVEAIDQLGGRAEILWHGDPDLGGVDAVVVPGGFAHGDYLRPGAIARFSPIMGSVVDFAESGGPVVGICNGFQVLTEAHLLPGALQKNRGLTFLCQSVEVEVVSDRSVLTHGIAAGTRLRIPINHFEGNYTCDSATLAELHRQDRVVLRYVDNPNGSLDDIAGICNEAGNVVGLMPHPERASDALLGSTDGQALLRALLAAAGAVGATAPSPAAPGSGARAAPGRPGARSVSS
jgi:phosphoribosylformylglycinamidine synthase subunit PurQ / glutaminase